MRELSQERSSFGWDLNRDGKSCVGNCYDEWPFVIELTNKTLVQRLTVPPESFIQYKFTRVPGDRGRDVGSLARFSLFIVSQERQNVNQSVLMVRRRLYFRIASRELVVKYTMTDADQAHFNALSAGFGGAGQLQTRI